jgi:hypothetical protein
MTLAAFQTANLAIRFLLELTALAALGWWGWQTGRRTLTKVALAVSAPLLAATAWAMFAAPGTETGVPAVVRLGVQVAVLGGAAAALAWRRRTALATTFATLVLANAALMALWGQ